ncbi:MAG: hypothetical protein HC774_00365, partial [Sphingomonadales bacterium]|nr:hypothetical protein [Sphingomonadales bacterium]
GRLDEAAAIGRKLKAKDAGSDMVILVLAMQELKAGKIDAALSGLAALSTTGRLTSPLKVKALTAASRSSCASSAVGRLRATLSAINSAS